MRNSIEHQKNIIDFALSSLLRRKGKNAGLLFVYTLVVFALASVVFFSHSIRKEASIILEGTPEMIVQKIVAGRHDLIPLIYMDRIEKIRGVSSVKGRLWGYYYDPVVGANYTLIVPEHDRPEKENIVIGEGISRTRLPFEGDRLAFRSHDGKIINLKVKQIISSE